MDFIDDSKLQRKVNGDMQNGNSPALVRCRHHNRLQHRMWLNENAGASLVNGEIDE
jgi:hypothetical protein